MSKAFFLISFLANISCNEALQVQRMSAQEYQTKRRQPGGHLALDCPILITGALPVQDCEELCEEWIQSVGSEMITIQRKKKDDNMKSTTQLYECTVAQSLDLMMKSTSNDSIFAFLEGLLDSRQVFGDDDSDPETIQQQEDVLDSIQDRLTMARESLFSGDDINWFDYFPDNAKPLDCVVLAGEGATSTLHRDPFEWTGTSLCLEGRKIWRFLKPSDDADWDARLQYYRLNSTAWDSRNDNDGGDSDDDDNSNIMTLSAGWQSDLSLYQSTSTAHTAASPSSNVKFELLRAHELAEMDDAASEEYLEQVATTYNAFQPHPDIQPMPVMGVDCCSVVQHPGELLFIPPYWYHQTYAPEPSLAVASQRCGSRLDATRVVQHILSLQSTPSSSELPPALHTLIDGSVDPVDGDAEETVKVLFDYLQMQEQQQRR